MCLVQDFPLTVDSSAQCDTFSLIVCGVFISQKFVDFNVPGIFPVAKSSGESFFRGRMECVITGFRYRVPLCVV